MAHYPNGGQYYRPGSSQQEQGSAGYQTASYGRRPSYDTTDEAAFAADGRAHGYGSMGPAPPRPPRRGTNPVRQDAELFIGADPSANPPFDAPSTPQRADFGQYHPAPPTPNHRNAYNPRQYSPPVQIPNPQQYGGVNRTQYNPVASQPTYNPAAYADPSLGRGSSIASRGYGHSPTAYSTSPTAQFPSPSAHRPSTADPHLSPTSSASRHAGYTPPAPPPVPVPPHADGAMMQSWHDPTARRPSAAQMHSLHNNPLPSPPVHQGYHHGATRHDERRSPSSYHSNPLPPTPGAIPTEYSPQRMNTSGRHPQSRPLPGPPLEEEEHQGYFDETNGLQAPCNEALFDEVENAVMNAGVSPRGDAPVNGDRGEPPFYASLAGGLTTTNGHPPYEEYVDSDPEAAYGVAMLQEQDNGFFTSYMPQVPAQPGFESDQQSDGSFPGVDVSTFDGTGAAVLGTYGMTPTESASSTALLDRSQSQTHTMSSSGSMRQSGETSDVDYDPYMRVSGAARTDTFGTGGFADPTMSRRRSYDEGDETSLMNQAAGEPPDMFYHPGMPTRPLPPPPVGDQSFHQGMNYQYDANRVPFPSSHDYISTPSGATVPRSTSLVSHSTTQQTIPPIRSKTDAEERRLRSTQMRAPALYEKTDSSGDNLTPPTGSTITLDLPALPTGKRFSPSKLTPRDFAKCSEPWALSSIISWLRMMAEGESDLKEHLITDGLVALFTHKVPTMNVADAEYLAAQVVEEMYKVGTLEHVEEWLKFKPATTSGVIYQLTGSGCYASKLHDVHTPGRCYAHHCQRTLKKIDLRAQPSVKQTPDWATFYKLKKEDLEGVNQKEVTRQNMLHEIVTTEDNYMESLNVLRIVYRDHLMQMQPPVIPPKKLKWFIRDVFGKLEPVIGANEEHLLPQLKYRQQEQGPWIVGFSDIFREWIRKAKSAYIEYAAAFPYATFLIRQESERNILFRSFLDQARANKMSNKLAWDNYLKSPITRLQHIGLLLNTALKKTPDGEEKKNLKIAIDEIKQVTLECDARVADMTRKVDLTDLQTKLILRPGMQRVELNLNHLGRELIYKGDLQRMGGTRYTWLEVHALLFDHYLVLAKTVLHREPEGGPKQERYDVSRLPIPMDLLVLESSNDDPVVRSSVKGVSSVSTASTRPESRLRAGSNASPAPLSHASTNSSLNSGLTSSSANKGMVVNTVLESPKDEKIMYPFRIKHLGKEVYTLFAPSAQNRQEWCEKILEAKTRHAASLFAQNAEPFRLRVMADAAFAYDGGSAGSSSITIKGTPLDRAIDEVENRYANTGRPGPICRAKVNCATAFMQPNGKSMVAVGTDFGVFISEVDNPRGWVRAISMSKVTQISVLEEFSIMLLIADKALIAYHLDLVCPVGGVPPSDSSRRAPQKLSGSRDVGFFATGKMKDRTLVFYKKREGLSSTFKVLEPVFQKSTEKKSRFLRTGRTDFFREYDDFYIPTECFGLNLFHSSLAISTSKGFEVLTLDKKQPWSVPDLRQPHVATINQRLQNLSPLGMFRLSDAEFLLCYEECAVYCNKHGDVSRSVIMEFVGKARSAALYGPYVLLFDPDFVEVRNAQNGRLRQVIPGREVKCLDDGEGLGGTWAAAGVAPTLANGANGSGTGMGSGGYLEQSQSGGANAGSSCPRRTVKLAMQHPRHERCQIVVELLLNEGQRD
ncbi:CNH domain-containing protein [Phyllosticta citricarpa]